MDRLPPGAKPVLEIEDPAFRAYPRTVRAEIQKGDGMTIHKSYRSCSVSTSLDNSRNVSFVTSGRLIANANLRVGFGAPIAP